MNIIYTSTRSRKRKNLTKKERELATSWQEILRKYDTKKTILKDVKPTTAVVTKMYKRETPYYPSLDTGTGTTAMKEVNMYTGDKMLGIATMHKSNLVPIFSSDDAVEVSKMRR
jgi:hypothetical protein